MSDLGSLLRKAREQRGYTLDDVQEATKIRKRYLEAIETGDYKILPGSFYVRAFVKTYAETVGLDAEEVLRLYQKELPKPTSIEAPSVEPILKASRRSDGQHSDRWGKLTVTLLMWLFPILIIAVLYVYLSQNHSKTPEMDPNKITSETPSAPATSPSGSSSVTPSPSPSATPTPSAITFTNLETRRGVNYIEVAPAGAHKLQLDITGDCWVDVNETSRTGKSLHSHGYKAAETPQTLSFDMNGPIYVTIGRADNAKISIDGTPFDDGDKANVARFVFTPAAAPQ
jgi:transcriptional regulator with XRE-family HTH domain